MRFLIRIIIALVLSAQMAQAGAWPREEGGWFLAVSQRVAGDPRKVLARLVWPDVSTDLYAEYGLSPATTLTFAGRYDQIARRGEGVIGVRRGFSVGAHRFAVSLGAGYDTGTGGVIGSTGLHWGRGFKLAARDGWIAADATFLIQPVSAAKLDVTLGLPLSDRFKAVFAVQAGQYAGQTAYLRVGPGLVWDIGRGNSIALSVDQDLATPTLYGITLGVWRSF